MFSAAITTGDREQRSLKWSMWHALPMRACVGLVRPTRTTMLGMELAGEIEAVGKDVRLLKKADQRLAATGFAGIGTCYR